MPLLVSRCRVGDGIKPYIGYSKSFCRIVNLVYGVLLVARKHV